MACAVWFELIPSRTETKHWTLLTLWVSQLTLSIHWPNNARFRSSVMLSRDSGSANPGWSRDTYIRSPFWTGPITLTPTIPITQTLSLGSVQQTHVEWVHTLLCNVNWKNTHFIRLIQKLVKITIGVIMIISTYITKLQSKFCFAHWQK